jgi:hypothetical protein
MKTTLKFATITLVVLSLTMCNPKQKAETKINLVITENFDWLLGKWQRTNDEAGRETFENWEKLNDVHYAGIGYTLQQGDTISQELMNLLKQENTWLLKVKIHSELVPTLFEVTNFTDSSFTCKNDSIDFPNQIKYWKEENKLNALVTGDSLEIAFSFEHIE